MNFHEDRPLAWVFSQGKSAKFRTRNMVAAACKEMKGVVLQKPPVTLKKGTRFLVAIESDEIGTNENLFSWIRKLYKKKKAGQNPLEGCVAGVVINAHGVLHTKRLVQFAVFHLNQLGCSFIGHALVEALENLENLQTWRTVTKMSLEEILIDRCTLLGKRLSKEKFLPRFSPNLLVLHASSQETSNTLRLSEMVTENLTSMNVRSYHIEENRIAECKGCSFHTCLGYAQQDSCYYEGVMLDEIIPSLEWADGVLWVCPNYNDALSAKLMAAINRMTGLYRTTTFHQKALFGIVVSGNSGSDLVMTQLLGALCLNKGFFLPAYFAIHSIASEPGSIERKEGIKKQAYNFAKHMEKIFKEGVG